MKKRIIAMLLGVSMLFTLAACSSNTNSSSSTTDTPPASTADGGSGDAAAGGDLTPITAGMLEGPVLITSVGQSADVAIVNTLFSKAGVEATQNGVITAEEFDGKYQTLVLAVGGSSKGLGAAGIDENQELERVKALIEAAQANGTKILTVHVGGSARRGTLSDKFIPDALANADVAIILSEGDSDNYMRDILTANNTPAEYVAQQMDVLEIIQTLFGS